jgi:aryl-alcohol dehydrogenase-like predicted oxidoreductase
MNRLFTKQNLRRGTPLLNTLHEIANSREISVSQLSLAWLIRTPQVVAIPGAKSVSQLESNAGAGDVELSQEDMIKIDVALSEFHPRKIL